MQRKLALVINQIPQVGNNGRGFSTYNSLVRLSWSSRPFLSPPVGFRQIVTTCKSNKFPTVSRYRSSYRHLVMRWLSFSLSNTSIFAPMPMMITVSDCLYASILRPSNAGRRPSNAGRRPRAVVTKPDATNRLLLNRTNKLKLRCELMQRVCNYCCWITDAGNAITAPALL